MAVDRVQTLCLPPAEAESSGAIEQGIRPLVMALNASGRCRTIASCHGHGAPWWRTLLGWLAPGSSWHNPPYVLFRTDIEFARNLHRLLDPHGHGRSVGTLLHWELNAYFYPGDFDLAWVLKAKGDQLTDRWTRTRIDVDLRYLAQIVSTI